MSDKEETYLSKLKEFSFKLKIWSRPNDILGIAFWTLILTYLVIVLMVIFSNTNNKCSGEFFGGLFCEIVYNTTAISLILMITTFLYSVFQAAAKLKKNNYTKEDLEALKYIKAKQLINILVISLVIAHPPQN